MLQTLALWVGFHVFVFGVLAIDLGIFNRKAHVPSFREALGWTIVWVTLAMLFAAGIWQLSGPHRAIQFVTGYIIEESLSVDNIFVFVLIFTFFAVPRQLQHRVLFWGILGAIVSRGTMIGLGVALFSRFAWIGYVFGLFLVYTGFKMLVEKERELHPEKNPFVRLVSKIVPVTRGYEEAHFFVHREGKTFATPLLPGAARRGVHRHRVRDRLDPRDLLGHDGRLHRLYLEHLRDPRDCARSTSCLRAPWTSSAISSRPLRDPPLRRRQDVPRALDPSRAPHLAGRHRGDPGARYRRVDSSRTAARSAARTAPPPESDRAESGRGACVRRPCIPPDSVPYKAPTTRGCASALEPALM
jgi:hypothetical protein